MHLFLAVSNVIRTHAGVVNEHEVIFLGDDVTPDPRLSSDLSRSKDELAPVAKSHKSLEAVSGDERCAMSCENSTLMTARLRIFSETTSHWQWYATRCTRGYGT